MGEIDYSAAIVDRAQYELSLFTNSDLGAVTITLRINEDEHHWRSLMPEQAGSSYVYRLIPAYGSGATGDRSRIPMDSPPSKLVSIRVSAALSRSR